MGWRMAQQLRASATLAALPWVWSPTCFTVGVAVQDCHPTQRLGSGSRRIRCSRSASVTLQVWGQPMIRDTLSQKGKEKKCWKIIQYKKYTSFLFLSFLRLGLSRQSWLSWSLLYRLSCPEICRNPLASVSQSLGLKVWATIHLL